MSTETTEYRDKDWKAPEYHELVVEIAQKCFDTISEKTEGITPQERWLVYSRVVLVLFQNHFGLSMKSAIDTHKENEKKL